LFNFTPLTGAGSVFFGCSVFNGVAAVELTLVAFFSVSTLAAGLLALAEAGASSFLSAGLMVSFDAYLESSFFSAGLATASCLAG
jgi:hypothetical protein